ncbi:hypothetical protein G4D61_16395 [Bacillus ginsengihumi]|uniref:Uncharacterized protein n=1 Tax=Heyndrickxia ginsengihumi TaxID=363870 RepID=A0A6M0P9R0_9BACI|nr:hypothetical protein [Heyndrickxia ginsengihumi]NEY21522.1 hypothetical protein [Heyndrickxia ginsengihumi]
MRKQTKLVECRSTVFIYDFKNRSNIEKMHFEKNNLIGELTQIKRLILTNFVDERYLATFTLRMQLSDYETAEFKIQSFIKELKKSSGHSRVKYLAVAELPVDKKDSIVKIHLITDIEFSSLTSSVKGFVENEEEYFSSLWGDYVNIEIFPQEILLSIIDNAYCQSLKSSHYTSLTKIVFKSRLKKPNILWNEEADAFIKMKNVFDYPYHIGEEMVDKVGGFVNVNVYSLYDTSFFTEELKSRIL